LQWALEEARYTDAAWLMVAVSYFWVLCGHGYEEARWLAQMLPYRHTLTNELHLGVTLTFYRAAFALEEFQPVDHYMDEIMQLLEDSPYKQFHTIAWSFRAWTATDAAQAAAHLEQAIVLTRAASEPPVLERVMNCLHLVVPHRCDRCSQAQRRGPRHTISCGS
jgi:hypothetical protein